MRDWRLDISDERAEILAYLFGLLEEHKDVFLEADFLEPATQRDFAETIDWFNKAYDRRKGYVAWKQKWT